ncbi:pollen receptor-like kinase 4 [Olea europaea subsp. europaea]|uniref:Pollen receptor-like kinase 4 n=1 Tax=Olea europaea subsp. europaea TaxID=158383 RepID=A0A8S0Q4X3_OLEEU|nr:pollen receptor-like kinase 4 [Olea europaea subsp. europaea]
MAYTLRKSFFVFFALLLCAITALSDDETYAKILIKFKSSISNTTMQNSWIEPVENLCSGYKPIWTGLVCDNGTFTDDAFSGMKSMRKVVLGFNEHVGKIPMSLLELPRLVNLQLQNNQIEGRIPDLWQKNLIVNFANNKLEGPIPSTLSSQSASSFSGKS